MDLYTRNVCALMRMCRSSSARFLAYNYEGRVEKFLEFINLDVGCIVAFAEGDEDDAERNCHDVFRYGWLNPQGEFVKVRYAEHEQTVGRVTGYNECDTACEAGWLKFTVGLPYNHEGECIFVPGADRSLLSPAQRQWLNDWMKTVTVDDGKRPVF